MFSKTETTSATSLTSISTVSVVISSADFFDEHMDQQPELYTHHVVEEHTSQTEEDIR